jgi:hypothetical protein
MVRRSHGGAALQRRLAASWDLFLLEDFFRCAPIKKKTHSTLTTFF